jgi:diguanylate cyclase (GGDEF)-like protein
MRLTKPLFGILHAYGHDPALRQTFEQAQLDRSQQYGSTVAWVTGLIFLFLIVPDLIRNQSFWPAGMIAILRLLIAATLFGVGLGFKRRKVETFQTFSTLVTWLEAVSVLAFLLVFRLYSPPNFLIQTMGMIITILVIFFVPNRWLNMLAVSVMGAAAFLLLARLVLPDLPANEFYAGLVYLLVTLTLCALYAWNLDKHQILEYQAKQALIRSSTIDPLTQACNRSKLIESFEQWAAFCRRSGQPLALALFDIDNFKQINDQHGHSVADIVLIELVALIKSQLRRADLLARWGGDEFILLFPNTSAVAAVIVLNRLRTSLSEQLLADHVRVSCSYGVVEMSGEQNLDKLIHMADLLMYEGKRTGGNKICHQDRHVV